MPPQYPPYLLACHSWQDYGAEFEQSLASASVGDKQVMLAMSVSYWCDFPEEASRGPLQVVGSLLAAGANPLEAAGSASPPFSAALFNNYPAVALHLLNLMSSAQSLSGHECLDATGGNALHALTAAMPSWLGSALYSALNDTRMSFSDKQIKHHPLSCRIHPDWVVQHRQNDRATPLHLAWRFALHEPLPRVMDAAFSQWDVNEILVGLGASLEVPDIHGDIVASLVMRCVENGIAMPEKLLSWPLIKSTHEHHRLTVLSASSAVAPTPRRSL